MHNCSYPKTNIFIHTPKYSLQTGASAPCSKAGDLWSDYFLARSELKLGENGSRGFPMFLEIPGGASPFFCGLDDSARLKGIPDDKITDLFGL
jgi:hypothetical protein